MTDNLVPRHGNCDCPCHLTVGVQHVAACCWPQNPNSVKSQFHWAIIWSGDIVIAQGYCRCGEPNGNYHSIEASGPSD